MKLGKKMNYSEIGNSSKILLKDFSSTYIMRVICGLLIFIFNSFTCFRISTF